MNTTNLMDMKAIQALSQADMQKVNESILAQLNSDVVLINQLGFYIVQGGGKRIRPLIAVLAARALGFEGQKAITCATFVEFIHTASLLHDDVVDESDMRRGRATANAEFGNAASVLVGDFIYTRAFQLVAQLESLKILRIMADATNVLAEGEVQQLMNVNDPQTSEENYMRVIYSKTARLFEVAAQAAAIIADADDEQVKALQNYGRYLGTAFQLVDDVLDYSASAKALGKNVGDDLAEGKPTLPLIYLMQQGNDVAAQDVRTALQNADREYFDQIHAHVTESDALNYCMEQAKKAVAQAISCLKMLPENEVTVAMRQMAELSVARVS